MKAEQTGITIEEALEQARKDAVYASRGDRGRSPTWRRAAERSRLMVSARRSLSVATPGDRPVSEAALRELRAERVPVVGRYEELGTGTIGDLCGEQARWSEFMMALIFLQSPPDWKPCFDPGVDIVEQCNDFVRAALEPDRSLCSSSGTTTSSTRDPDRLLEADVDVCVPNCLQRRAPFNPVIYRSARRTVTTWSRSICPTGMHDIFAAGSAGMLIASAGARRATRAALPALGQSPERGSGVLPLRFAKRASSSGSTSRRTWRTSARWSSGRSRIEDGWGIMLDIGPQD